MKKLTVAALASAMTVSLAAAPMADAASNFMVGGKCDMSLNDKTNEANFQLLDPDVIALTQDFVGGSALGSSETSFKVSQAFGSSDRTQERAIDDLRAFQACAEKRNYYNPSASLEPITPGEQAGIIIGVVLSALAVIVPLAWPMIQPYLPF